MTGLWAERTRLSWRRTVLALTVVALLAGRLAVHRGATAARLLVLAAATVLWLVVLLVSHRRIRGMATDHQAAVGRSLTVLSLCTVGYAVIGALVLLVS